MVPKDRCINKNRPKRYIAIVKISNKPDGCAYCVKYRFDDLLKFVNFLDKKWSEWKWFNVYSNKGTDKGKQLGNFTNKNRPVRKHL
jgi:hypothetical protein